jgi:hypothetical protein
MGFGDAAGCMIPGGVFVRKVAMLSWCRVFVVSESTQSTDLRWRARARRMK